MTGFNGLAIELAKKVGGAEIKLQTLKNGVKVDVPGQILSFNPARRIASRIRRLQLPHETLQEISYDKIKEIVKTIGLYNMHDGSYASIKSSTTFQTFYGYAKRSVNYLEGDAVVHPPVLVRLFDQQEHALPVGMLVSRCRPTMLDVPDKGVCQCHG